MRLKTDPDIGFFLVFSDGTTDAADARNDEFARCFSVVGDGNRVGRSIDDVGGKPLVVGAIIDRSSPNSRTVFLIFLN